MVMTDSPEFVIVYLAAMRMGAVPVPISTMLRADGIAEILADSRARGIAVSAQYLDLVADGRIDLRPMLTHTFRLEQWRDAFLAIANQGDSRAVKVAFDQR